MGSVPCRFSGLWRKHLPTSRTGNRHVCGHSPYGPWAPRYCFNPMLSSLLGGVRSCKWSMLGMARIMYLFVIVSVDRAMTLLSCIFDLLSLFM